MKNKKELIEEVQTCLKDDEDGSGYLWDLREELELYFNSVMYTKTLEEWSKEIFENNRKKGFWNDAYKLIEAIRDDEGNIVEFGEGQGFNPYNRNVGECIALMHSELSEALEAHRKDLMDDKLPEYPGLHVEIIDTLIRILDFCGAHQIPITEIMEKKLEFNKTRAALHGKNY